MECLFTHEKRSDSHKLVNVCSCIEADQIGILSVGFYGGRKTNKARPKIILKQGGEPTTNQPKYDTGSRN